MNHASIFLNHIFFFISAQTYQEIGNSDFLKHEFCHLDEKTHSAGNATWTGIYLTGKNTYIELFNAKDQDAFLEMDIGKIGVMLSVDHNEELKPYLNDHMTQSLFEKHIDDKSVPWFYCLIPTNEASMMPNLSTAIMSYHPAYLKAQNIKGKSCTRSLYNTTCNAVPFDETKLFKDIEEVTVKLDESTSQKFIKYLISLDYTCKEHEGYTLCNGPEITLKIITSKEATPQVSHLRLSLNHSVDKAHHTFDSSTLTLEGSTANWVFE